MASPGVQTDIYRSWLATDLSTLTPVRLYHGTAGLDEHFQGRVFWAAPRPLADDYAALYAGPCIAVSLYARAPLDADQLPKTIRVEDFVEEVCRQGGLRRHDLPLDPTPLLRAYAREEESGPYYRPHEMWYKPHLYFGRKGESLIFALLRAARFDSIRYTEQEQFSLGVLSPCQVFHPDGVTPLFRPRTMSPVLLRKRARRLSADDAPQLLDDALLSHRWALHEGRKNDADALLRVVREVVHNAPLSPLDPGPLRGSATMEPCP